METSVLKFHYETRWGLCTRRFIKRYIFCRRFNLRPFERGSFLAYHIFPSSCILIRFAACWCCTFQIIPNIYQLVELCPHWSKVISGTFCFRCLHANVLWNNKSRKQTITYTSANRIGKNMEEHCATTSNLFKKYRTLTKCPLLLFQWERSFSVTLNRKGAKKTRDTGNFD